MPDLMHCIYASSARHHFETVELTALLHPARKHNDAAGLTGMLLYTEGSFFQVLDRISHTSPSYHDPTCDEKHPWRDILVTGDIDELAGNLSLRVAATPVGSQRPIFERLITLPESAAMAASFAQSGTFPVRLLVPSVQLRLPLRAPRGQMSRFVFRAALDGAGVPQV